MDLGRTYKILTLGCKLNQFDSASIEGMLRTRGFRGAIDAEEARIVVINTCAVTSNADREARRLARRARRENPGCRLIVTGCYAELDRERLASMNEVDAVIGHSDREKIPAVLDRLAAESAPAEAPDISCIAEASGSSPLHFGDRSRAFLKVQEGCDLRCSYCIIPKLRGPSRSVAPELVAAALRELIDDGYREVVLTGVNTGDYGKDLGPRTDLAALLTRLLQVRGLGRLRLNSLEPRTITSAIVDLLAGAPGLARHLQVPLQSGSDRILRLMRRNYRSSDYMRVLEGLRSAIPGIGLGADIIVGFPGEDDEDFETTYRFVARSPLNYLHVFSYSDRPGTRASGLGDRPAPERVKERSARLRALADELGLAFRRSFVGRTLPVLVLREARPEGRWRALSDNFIDMEVAARPEDVNTIASARIISADLRGTTGALAGPAIEWPACAPIPAGPLAS